jgi:N-glycosidase YbiA
MPILFSSKSADYRWLSNFSEHGFALDDLRWPSVEHYYQAQKFPAPETRERIRAAAKPVIARQMARDPELQSRADWDEVKDQLMRCAVLAKFSQNRELRERLLSTGAEELVHESKNDLHWGRNAKGQGKNRLGVILMDIRAVLAAESGMRDWAAPHDLRAT